MIVPDDGVPLLGSLSRRLLLEQEGMPVEVRDEDGERAREGRRALEGREQLVDVLFAVERGVVRLVACPCRHLRLLSTRTAVLEGARRRNGRRATRTRRASSAGLRGVLRETRERPGERAALAQREQTCGLQRAEEARLTLALTHHRSAQRARPSTRTARHGPSHLPRRVDTRPR